MATATQEITDRPSMDDAIKVINPVVERFEAGELDAVEVVFAKFVSPLSTPATTLQVLPVDVTVVDTGAPRPSSGTATNYILRPSAEAIIGGIMLVPPPPAGTPTPIL